ncbi:hypothetical protein JQ582_40805 [Bradyrhizobium japonicum]|uniref:hypothetical protein n=1 Tax=Bradyrhizobium japonicum TaxID=375 RepID=UPI001BA7CCD1|nr:hypothetical protein [Bradyrhizobium japonicum]MBR0750260.1 hypothetical protein [Bradyrhizobium japonicum]
MSRTKNVARPDLEIPVEAWGTIKGATAKLAWFAQVDAAIAAGLVGGSFAQLAINIATNPKGVNSQTGLTWRSARTLADETGLTKSTVKRLLDEAVAAGLLFVVQKGRPGRDGQSTIYRLAMPEAGNGPPVRRFQRKKRPTYETKNPENGPSMVPETAHPCSRKRPTSGTHLLRDSISVENNLRVAAEGGATTARGDSSNTARAVRESTDGSSAGSEPLASAPSAPHGAWKEPDIASQLTPPPSATVFPLDRDNPRASIGCPPDGAHAANADADAERTAVIDHGRKVLGAGCETLVARLHDAERAVDPDGAAERVHDGLDAASNEDDPVAHIENAIEIAESLGC